MKSMYTLAFAVTVLVLIICIRKASENENPIAGTLKKLLLAAAFAVCVHITLLYSTSFVLSKLLFGVFFASMDWLLFFVLRFAMEFADRRMEDYVKVGLMRALLLCDTAFVILGGIFGFVFTCELEQLVDGSMYIAAKQFPLYNIHLAVSYMLLAFAICSLCYKAAKVSPFYRRKYLIVIGIFLAVALGDGIYLIRNELIDASIIGFALGGVVVCHYALIYEPRELINRTYAMVAQDMDAAVFLTDEDGRCVHANESAYKMFPLKNKTGNIAPSEFSWMQGRNMKEVDGEIWEWSEERENRRCYYSARFQCLLDEKERYIGGFFTIWDRTEVNEKLMKEHYRASYDSLTGIYNKEYFFEQVAETLNANQEEEYVLLCSDIKDFKFINDVFGTETGDQILKRIATAIKEDTKPGEVYGRVENDRFGILVKKKDFDEGIFEHNPKKMIHIEQGNTYPVNIYVGVYEVQDRTLPVSIMCDRAFMAIQTIKGNYQQKVAYYDDTLRERVLKAQELTDELQEALEQGQFQIYLQPQTTKDGKVPGAEALVRWPHPVKGMIMPGEFISIFEENGMIVKLDRYIWELACAQLKKWKDAGREDMYLSVNISPKDFYLTDIYQTFIGLTEKYGICPRNLKLEITETAVIMNLERQLELIEKLRGAGFIVEMDDFGSGYSSLNMLKDIRVDVLKIDMAFLRHSSDEVRSRKILKMMVELADELGMPAITEGVETEEQVQFLTEVGCGMFQGYYFAKPMPVEEFEKKYMQIG